jgi:hypothetical protein
MIAERATRLIELSQEYDRREQQRKQWQDYQRLRDGLKEVNEILFPPFGTAVTLRDLRDPSLGDLRADGQARQLKEQAAEAMAKFNASPASLVGQTSFPLPTFKRTASGIAGRTNDELTRTWAGYVERSAPSVPLDLVELFSRIPGKRELASQVQRLDSEVRRAPQNPPRDRDDLDQFHDLLKRLVDALQALFRSGDGRGSISLELQQFIQSASAPGGAPLTSITPEVLAGLSQIGILGAFAVRTSTTRTA